jgi:hypothetical protein
MQNFIIPVNNEALSRALVAVAGEETAALICKAYKVIDEAMQFGHAQGTAEAEGRAKVQAEDIAMKQASVFTPEEGSERKSYGIGWDDGYEEGFADGTKDARSTYVDQESFDEGYAEGVHDARVRPEVADEYLAGLVDADTELLDEDFDASPLTYDGTKTVTTRTFAG